jgi:hypothetical protein
MSEPTHEIAMDPENALRFGWYLRGLTDTRGIDEQIDIQQALDDSGVVYRKVPLK